MSPLITRTCQEFADQGFEVELWVPRRLNPKFKDVDPYEYHGVKRNFRIKRLWTLDFLEVFGGSFSFLLMLFSFAKAVFLKAILEKEAIYYFHDLRDAYFFSFLNRVYFLEMHDFYLSSVEFVNKRTIRKAKGIISTNRIKIERLKDKYGVSEEKMHHAPNAVDTEMFDPPDSKKEAREKLALSQDEKIVLYTGHLFYWKGVDTLLAASKKIEAEVYFVGGTDEDIRKFREEASGVKNVHVVGRRPHREIPLWQRAADVLVLPNTARYEESRLETSPVKLFEYMASGTPIVASDIPSIRNVLKEDMAVFFEADNPEKFSIKVNEVIQGTTELTESSNKAKREIIKYSWQNRVEHISLFISNIHNN